jgi:carbamoyl-phosphate synthase large subunit
VDILLGPEMRSTGEVMGIARDMGAAFAKSQIAAGNRMPSEGTVFLSLNDRDKPKIAQLGRGLAELGFKIVATGGTAARLRAIGVEVQDVFKVGEGRPNVVDLMINGEVDWIINTPFGVQSKYDEKAIRRTALELGLPTMTTLAAARAAVEGLKAMRSRPADVISLQEYHAELAARTGTEG